MEKVIEFATNNYGWILTITILLVFGLVGYFVDSKKARDNLAKKKEEEIDADYLKNLLLNDETKQDVNIMGKKIETVQNVENPNTENINN